MSDQRINLAGVRSHAERRRTGTDGEVWAVLNPADVLALVEAVEAAHAVDESSDISPEAIETAWEELAQALARFDFEPRP